MRRGPRRATCSVNYRHHALSSQHGDEKGCPLSAQLTFLAIMVGLLTACGDDSQRQREQELMEQRNKELALMTDMTLAGPQIERRLRERLQSDGEIVVIKDKPGEVFVLMRAMPAIVSWTADCGLGGLNVSLGYATENEKGIE